MRLLMMLTLLCVISHATLAQPEQSADKKIIIITLDGFRWQELFRGADEAILHHRKYVPDRESVSQYKAEGNHERRKQLLPFFWNTIAVKGQLYGNRDVRNLMNCSNPYWFSYPGYNEIFVGAVDRKVCTNAKVQNPNANVLEFLNRDPDFKNRVAAFATWDVFPFILRESLSGIPINSGLEPTGGDSVLTCAEELLNKRLYETGNRTDSITFHMGFEYLKKYRPRILYFAFDGTDHYAHAARYDKYLDAAHQIDQWIAQLWNWIESEPAYRGQTTLLITTDHGRGYTLRKSWRHHGRFTRGSGQIWMATMGPEVPAFGEMTDGPQISQRQIASTIAALVGSAYKNEAIVGPIIQSVTQPVFYVAEGRK